MGSIKRLPLYWNTGILRNFSLTTRNPAYDGDGKTTVAILNKCADYGIMVDGYSKLGFRLNNGMFVSGPMAIFPRTALSWNVEGDHDINEKSLSLFSLIEPKLDLLVIGFGKTFQPYDAQRLHNFRIKSKINIEIQQVEKAVATFNYLCGEGRWIAGAFVPPAVVTISEKEKLDGAAGKQDTFIYKPGETY